MFLAVVCVFGVFVSANSASLPLPDYITACHRDDPKLNECALKSSNEAYKEFVKGDTKYKIPVLSPFKLDEVNLDTGESLKIKFTDLDVIGLQNVVFKDVNIDVNKKQWKIILTVPDLKVDCTYDINGKILILPITGKGPAKLSISNPILTYVINYELIEKKGVEYMKVINPEVSFTEDKIHFQFDNLFGGDERLGSEMNKFLNENYADVATEVRPAISEAVSAIATSVLTKFLHKIPYDAILPK